MYTDKDYCCPKCGLHSDESSDSGHYSIICSNCGEDYETPDT